MYDMKLADIGEGMTEGTIANLLVNVGDHIERDQPVMEVQTDKVVAELPAPVSGHISEIPVESGEVVEVGSVVIRIQGGNEEIPDDSRPREPKETSMNSPGERLHRLRNVKAAPYTRKVAREYCVQIEEISGTGKGGRITVGDVLHFAEGEASDGRQAEDKEAAPQEEPAQSIPYKGRRKQIGLKMTHSAFTIPHVTHFDKVEMDALLNVKEQMQSDSDVSKISIIAFVLKALSISLKEFPIFNAKLNEDEETIILEPEINIGIAAQADEGLIVPVLRNVDEWSITQVNDQMKALTKKAQKNELSAKELQGATFTTSNVGPIGGMFATPIINHPEVALLSFHQMEEVPVIRNKEVVARSMMNFSMSFDHRVADGYTAVQFTNNMKKLLENPMQLFAHLK